MTNRHSDATFGGSLVFLVEMVVLVQHETRNDHYGDGHGDNGEDDNLSKVRGFAFYG